MMATGTSTSRNIATGSTSMLFAAAPSLPLPLLPYRLRCHAATVVAFATKLPMRLTAMSRTGEGKPEEAVGLAADASVRSDRVSRRRNLPPVPSPGEDSAGSSVALTGSDVLRALQRAVAKREARKMSNKRKRRRTATADGRENGGEAFDHGEHVRPIEIRSDWGQRIDELDKRIQELRSQYH